MMGSPQVEQGALFYNFSLEAYVPGDHLLRSVDRFVDLAGLRRELAPFYSQTGRPSVDPELMIRMLIVGYCFGIRSERGLCDEVPLNLAYRLFCRLGLDGRVPDHSTFSKNATAASATATSCDACLRPCSLAASPRVSSEARARGRRQPDQGGREPAEGRRGHGWVATRERQPGFDRGVTLIGGFPFPICTPAHGTAYDIAGRGIASVGASREALLLAIRMASDRLGKPVFAASGASSGLTPV